MILKAEEGFVWENKHTGEQYDVIAIPTGWEDIYEQVEIDLEISENHETISDRLDNLTENVKNLTNIINEIKTLLKHY